MLMACMGLFIWAAVVLTSVGADPIRIVVRFFDMITIAVPPALPACLTIATVFSVGRLKKKGIYVTGPEAVTVAGQLDVICFDKTGELQHASVSMAADLKHAPRHQQMYNVLSVHAAQHQHMCMLLGITQCACHYL